MSKVKALLSKLVRRLLMKAAFWTAVGTVLVPIGVLLVVEIPSWGQVAFWLIVAGLVSFVSGWVYTIRRERQEFRESEARIRREKATFIVLTHLAAKLGVNINKVIEMEEKHLDGE